MKRRPGDCPDYRLWLRSQAHVAGPEGPHGDVPDMRDWWDEMLLAAPLWWASPEMVSLAQHAASTLPADVRLGDVACPTSAGLLIFGDTHDGVEGFVWEIMERGLLVFPLVSQDLTRWTAVVWRDGPPLAEVSAPSVWLLAAVFLLLEQRIAVEHHEPVSRAVRRRAEKAGVASEVRVLTWRRPAGDADENGSGLADWSCRWWVSGHWRQQPCGPQRRERRLTYVAPYIKGPEDKPLDVRPTVNVWRR